MNGPEEGISMTPITATAAVAIARIEATLDGVKKQIDHQDRNTGQLVKMFEERMVSKIDDITRRLDSMEKAREDARREHQQERAEVDVRLKELEQKALDRAEAIAREAKEEAKALEARMSLVEKFNQKLMGVAIGVGVASGGTFAIVAKAIGGL